MNRTHTWCLNSFFKVNWSLIYKFMFFCIGKQWLLYKDSTFTLGTDYVVFQTLKRSGTWWHVSLLLSVPCFFWESPMRANSMVPLLQFASSRHVLIIIGMKVCPLQTFISQDSTWNVFRITSNYALLLDGRFPSNCKTLSLWVLKVLLAAKECSCLSVVCLWLFLSILQWFHLMKTFVSVFFFSFLFVILTGLFNFES